MDSQRLIGVDTKIFHTPWRQVWEASRSGEQKCRGAPVRNHVLFEKETLGSPFEGARDHVIVPANLMICKEMRIPPPRHSKKALKVMLVCDNREGRVCSSRMDSVECRLALLEAPRTQQIRTAMRGWALGRRDASAGVSTLHQQMRSLVRYQGGEKGCYGNRSHSLHSPLV